MGVIKETIEKFDNNGIITGREDVEREVIFFVHNLFLLFFLVNAVLIHVAYYNFV